MRNQNINLYFLQNNETQHKIFTFKLIYFKESELLIFKLGFSLGALGAMDIISKKKSRNVKSRKVKISNHRSILNLEKKNLENKKSRNIDHNIKSRKYAISKFYR